MRLGRLPKRTVELPVVIPLDSPALMEDSITGVLRVRIGGIIVSSSTQFRWRLRSSNLCYALSRARHSRIMFNCESCLV